mmetsp:Transcript_15919/g.16100  ORF Transcript_15919/g.16100 Transcript_15919/m.16100 type:complete len:155 (-) Transcript_15919:285-749(-)
MDPAVTAFLRDTVQTTVFGGRFIVRYPKDPCEMNCGDEPKAESWPELMLPFFGDESRESEASVIAAAWYKGQLCAVWAQDQGDCHIEMFCPKSAVCDTLMNGEQGLNALTGYLSDNGEWPEMLDVLDDGSGTDRDPIVVESLPLSKSLMRLSNT